MSSARIWQLGGRELGPTVSLGPALNLVDVARATLNHFCQSGQSQRIRRNSKLELGYR